MIRGKEAYLRRLTSSIHVPSMEIGRDLGGSSPPSVFIGSWGYPRVYAGPMIAPLHGDTTIMDRPESWIAEQKTQEEIVGYRLSLVRGKQRVAATDLSSRTVEGLQEIALSSTSVESEATFSHAPKGAYFSDEHMPFGPSAQLERLQIGGVSWDRHLERVFNDDDLRASEAVVQLHMSGVPFSSIQKAFSVGAMGTRRRRRLVPTRWSITACDSILADRLLEEVRGCDLLERFQVREAFSLNNYYAVLLLPTTWQYEWTEAFLHILGEEEMVFSDHEDGRGKAGYSRVGGCYYSCRMALLEALAREGIQAGAIVLREAYRGYVPLGVFNVRENVRLAMAEPPLEFDDIRSALLYISSRLRLPIRRFAEAGRLLREAMRCRQTRLGSFA